jgi:3'(2'), 5'-bisphosphate nucleotidase
VTDDLTDDVAVAVEAAEAAARALLRVRETGSAGTALGDAGDAAGQRAVAEVLARRRPDDAVLSEEAADDPRRLHARRVWIVDPLDGTREYREPGRPDWAVHVALWADGDLVAGAVALPALGTVLRTDPPPVVPPHAGGPLRVAVSRTRPPAQGRTAAAALGAELVPMGSAGWKVAAVVRGEVDAYVHAGGMYQWDSAAPVAVARAAGLHTSRLDGSPLRYNGPELAVPDLLVCRPELGETILTAVTGGR